MSYMKNKGAAEAAWYLAAIIGIAAWVTASTPFVLSRLWLWFAVPLGAAPVSWSTCFGLGLAVALLRGSSTNKTETPDEFPWGKLLGAAAMPWLVYAIGWVASQ